MAVSKVSILIAFLVTIASGLACGSLGQTSLTEPRMAFDEPGSQVTTVFYPSNEFYAVANLNNAPKGTVVSVKWYAVNVVGYEPGFLDETVLTINEDSFTGHVSFQYMYEDPVGWPPGEYKAEFYLNNTLTHTLNFSVH